jgi:hypothetical protein
LPGVFVGQVRNLGAKSVGCGRVVKGRCLCCEDARSVVRMVPVLAE